MPGLGRPLRFNGFGWLTKRPRRAIADVQPGLPTSLTTAFSNTYQAFPLRRILTVSELTGLVRTSLETDFSDVWLEGEISNLRAPGSGHLYCTMKDEVS